jgi:hypothetical protein
LANLAVEATDWIKTPIRLVPFAEAPSIPTHIKAGMDMREPPPAMTLMNPAATPAMTKMKASATNIPSMQPSGTYAPYKIYFLLL